MLILLYGVAGKKPLYGSRGSSLPSCIGTASLDGDSVDSRLSVDTITDTTLTPALVPLHPHEVEDAAVHLQLLDAGLHHLGPVG